MDTKISNIWYTAALKEEMQKENSCLKMKKNIWHRENRVMRSEWTTSNEESDDDMRTSWLIVEGAAEVWRDPAWGHIPAAAPRLSHWLRAVLQADPQPA